MLFIFIKRIKLKCNTTFIITSKIILRYIDDKLII